MSVIPPKTRFFWGLLLVTALAAAIVALRIFPLVAPGLSVEINISREQALAEAERLHQQLFPELETSRSAAQFVSDRHLQNYVELEAGGLEAFQQLISQAPDTHYWKLRRFSEGQQDELIIALSPAGQPISFSRVIPDQASGAALEEAEARAIAEAGAREFMGERFDAYGPLETQTRRQTSGRVDHVFTYEHQSLHAGEARFRLGLRVAGDQLVSLDTYKHIPQAFEQRFAEMRGLNNQIATVASVIVQVLFLFGGGVLGCLWLYRHRQLRWRGSLLVAAIVGAGMGLVVLGNLPLSWMNYSTTDKASSFLIQQWQSALMAAVVSFLLVWVCLMAAEGFSRLAFAKQVDLFCIWRRPHAASPQLSAQVLGGYVFAGIFLLYAALFILLSSRVFGWWMPADLNSDPNILASWRPALMAIFVSLQAGIWEESLFRAIPLALAALIGRRFGIERGLVIFVLIFQALVFAAAHANYPQSPGYARVVELFVPAMAFGLVYLRYGLLPGIVCHVIYDLVLISLPLFWSDAPGLWVDRGLVIFVGVIPLLVLARAWLKAGGWVPLAESVRHGEPSAPPQPQVEEKAADAHSATAADSKPLSLPKWVQIVIVLLWAGVTLTTFNRAGPLEWPLFTADRQVALAQAEARLAERGVTLEGEWKRSINTTDGEWWPRMFVWHNSGAAEVQRLLGSYLDVPLWKVSWRRFDGPVEERSEAWEAWLYPDGQLKELVHRLPEGRPGARLAREEALAIARDWVLAQNWPDPAGLEEKSVEEIQRPQRTDWRITWLDLNAYNQHQGQASIRIYLSGDQVTGYMRTIEVPEEWGRDWNERQSGKTPFKVAAGLVGAVLVILAIVGLFGPSTGRKFSFTAALPIVLLVLAGSIGSVALVPDSITAQLDPTQDWKMQMGILIFTLASMAAILATVCFFAAQPVYARQPLPGASTGGDLLLALTFAGVLALGYIAMEVFWPSAFTPGPVRGHVDAISPLAAGLLAPLTGINAQLIQLVLLMGIIGFLKARWRLQLVIALVIVWFVASSLGDNEPWRKSVFNLFFAIKLLLAFVLIRRSQPGVALAFLLISNLVMSSISLTGALYADAQWHGWLVAAFLAVVTIGLASHWHRHKRA
jgi:hypothetical protein